MSIVGEGCSPVGRRHEVTVGEAPQPRNAPPETFPIISLYHAEHINLSVGYGACDVPKPFLSMTPKRGANACFRREDQRSSENDGRFIDRKRRIGYKRSCHAVRRQAPYPTKRTYPQRTSILSNALPREQQAAPLQIYGNALLRVVGHACLRRPLQILRNTLSRIVEHAYSNVIPYNSSASFTVGYGA